MTFSLCASLLTFRPALLLLSDDSVPGGTDGIVLMGVLIVLVIVLPILFARRGWMR